MLELRFQLVPDAHGVLDGRELARQMIGSAYRYLIPYVNACPACADALFSTIANQAIEDLHREGQNEGKLKGILLSGIEDAEERGQAEADHLAVATESTRALLCLDDAHAH